MTTLDSPLPKHKLLTKHDKYANLLHVQDERKKLMAFNPLAGQLVDLLNGIGLLTHITQSN